jgi:hypothetical protein
VTKASTNQSVVTRNDVGVIAHSDRS